jgi:uncharacterized repeat protein (TIGR02543 family)
MYAENRVVIYAMQFPLAVPFIGGGSGVVSSQMGALACTATDCSAAFNGTTVISLTAVANTGSIFQGWGGECASVLLGDPCVATMDRAREISATFTLMTHTLSVSVAGTGTGSITAPGIDCGSDCSEAYSYGTNVSPVAEPADNSVLAEWSGACSGVGTCTIVMDGNKSVSASFAIKQLEVTLPGEVEGGTITVQEITAHGTAAEPAALDATYPYSTVLRFTAVPDNGYTFGGWTGSLQGQSNPVDVTLTNALNLGAVFNPVGGTPQPTPTSPAPGSDTEVYLPLVER